jgi:succinyl-diaminopimelate desuccinylase
MNKKTSSSATLDLTKTLISKPSITPDDQGCQKIIADRLAAMQFHLENMRFGEVDNLWARHGMSEPCVVFAGHTDVVPTGPLSAWESPPFTPTVRGDYLFGRGAADMKSGLAAMLVAVENFLSHHPTYPGSIGFLITSDEEGPSIDGTQKVIAKLVERNEKITYCIIGEASSNKILGDQIRVGRRGSLHCKITVSGKQGHVAYPELANNPIHAVSAALHALTTTAWDNGNEFFPPTTFQITNIHAGTGALNVIPSELELRCNWRFSTAITVPEIKERVEKILEQQGLHYHLQWDISGQPFLTRQGKLVQSAEVAIKEITGITPILSTGGGTSDGRFIAPTGAEVIEMGPCTASVHQANENVLINDLDKLSQIYECLLEKLFF